MISRIHGFRVKRVLICSGKHYYTLRNKRDSLQDNSTAIIRVEVNIFSFNFLYISIYISLLHRFIFSRAILYRALSSVTCSIFCHVLFLSSDIPFSFVLAMIVFISSFLSSKLHLCGADIWRK